MIAQQLDGLALKLWRMRERAARRELERARKAQTAIATRVVLRVAGKAVRAAVLKSLTDLAVSALKPKRPAEVLVDCGPWGLQPCALDAAIRSGARIEDEPRNVWPARGGVVQWCGLDHARPGGDASVFTTIRVGERGGVTPAPSPSPKQAPKPKPKPKRKPKPSAKPARPAAKRAKKARR